MPIQRLGEARGVLVVQDREARAYSEDDVHGLEVIAMVIAEMAELGAFRGEGPMSAVRPHSLPVFIQAVVGQEGAAAGTVEQNGQQLVVQTPVNDAPEAERRRQNGGDPRTPHPAARGLP